MNEPVSPGQAVGGTSACPDGYFVRAALVGREGVIFSSLYATHLRDAYGIQAFTAINERQVRQHLEAHPEIAFMLIDNRLPDMHGIERDGVGMAIAEEYGIPTILVTGGPVASHGNPLITCVFAINWKALMAATRWAIAFAQRQAVSCADKAILAETLATVRRSSLELYREVAREAPPPPGLQPYEPIDERHIRQLRSGQAGAVRVKRSCTPR